MSTDQGKYQLSDFNAEALGTLAPLGRGLSFEMHKAFHMPITGLLPRKNKNWCLCFNVWIQFSGLWRIYSKVLQYFKSFDVHFHFYLKDDFLALNRN